VPPLRERLDDIPLLASYFLEVLNEKEGKNITSFEPEVLQALQHHAWPGNVRELRNVVNRAYILASSDTITMACLPDEFKLKSTPQVGPKARAVPMATTTLEIPTHAGQSTGGSMGADVGTDVMPATARVVEAATMKASGDHSAMLAIPVGTSIEEVEKLLIMRTLELNQGNKPKTAEALGISLKTLYNKLERYELKI